LFSHTAISTVSPTSYTWTRANVSGITPSTGSGSSAVISETLVNSTTNPINVKYAFALTANGCVSYDTLTVTVNPLPIVSITGKAPICAKDTLLLTGVPSGGSWTIESGGTGTATIGASNGKLVGSVDGTVIVRYTYTNTYGCTNFVDSTITVKPLPIVSITGSNSICAGTTTQLSPTTGGTWTSSNPTVANVDNTGLVTGMTTGKVVFTFEDAATRCTSTTDSVEVGTFPLVAPITGTNTVCEAHSGSVTLECTTLNGVWTLNNADAVITSQSNNPSPARATIEGVSTGKVYVTYTVGSGTCQTKSTFLLKIVSATPPDIIIGIER